jgi:hypothetical protein
MTEAQPAIVAIPAVGIAMHDQDSALAFYTEILGLQKQLDVSHTTVRRTLDHGRAGRQSTCWRIPCRIFARSF